METPQPRRNRLIACGGLLLALLVGLALPAPAASGATRHDRRDARAFVDAAESFQEAAAERGGAALVGFGHELEGCRGVVADVPDESREDVANGVYRAAGVAVGVAVRSPYKALGARMGRRHAHDPKLRAGAAAVLTLARLDRALGGGRFAICELLADWREHQWDPGFVLDLGLRDPTLHELRVGDRARARVRAAARRMRALGISRRDVHLFLQAASG